MAEQGEKINSFFVYNSIKDLIMHQEAKIFTKENYVYSVSFSKTQEIIKELSDIGLIAYPYIEYKFNNYTLSSEIKTKIDFNDLFPYVYAFDYGYLCNITLFSYQEKQKILNENR